MGKDPKGKKRALSEADSSQSSGLTPPPPVKVKKPKRAETRPCPVCEEDIPVRLLARHAELELQRVEDIMRGAGPAVVFQPEAGPSTNRRGAALKARISLSALTPRSGLNLDTLELADKTIRLLNRNRKQRNVKLREIISQEDADPPLSSSTGSGTTCPICLVVMRGDDDVVEAHVDACVAHASRLQAEAENDARERDGQDVDAWEEYEVNGEMRIRLTDVAGFRGTGFHIRDRNQRDMDEDVDVDGDDEAVFGNAQFTERDVLEPTLTANDADVAVEDETDNEGLAGGSRSLRELVADGKVITRRPVASIEDIKAQMDEVMGLGDADRMDQAIEKARQNGSISALVSALEDKVKLLESMRVSSSTSLLCRICLDPYNEPTVSKGCWHTCCRDCWLRCLGSTKLCPICKRITAATDLRRIYM